MMHHPRSLPAGPVGKKPLTGSDKMPFGQFQGVAMQDIPLTYLDWLMRQPWLVDWPAVHGYVESVRDSIEASRPKQMNPKLLTIYEEYSRWAK